MNTTAEATALEGRDKAESKLSVRALIDLTDRMLRGEEYPRKSRYFSQINLIDILHDVDQSELVYAIVAARKGEPMDDCLRPLVAEWLFESNYHTKRIEEMLAEEEEE